MMKKISEIFGGAAIMLLLIVALTADWLGTAKNGFCAMFFLIGIAAVFVLVSFLAEKRSKQDEWKQR